MSESVAVRCSLGTGMADLSLIPEGAWREAERRAAVAECEHAWSPLRAAEGDFDNLLKPTLKNDS